MATKVITTCDVPVRKAPCGKPAATPVEVSVGDKRYHGDVCDEHLPALDKAFAMVGIEVRAGRVDSKDRKVMRTATGRAFTTAEAREWLLEQGVIASPAGRVSKENLTLYAEAH